MIKNKPLRIVIFILLLAAACFHQSLIFFYTLYSQEDSSSSNLLFYFDDCYLGISKFNIIFAIYSLVETIRANKYRNLTGFYLHAYHLIIALNAGLLVTKAIFSFFNDYIRLCWITISFYAVYLGLFLLDILFSYCQHFQVDPKKIYISITISVGIICLQLLILKIITSDLYYPYHSFGWELLISSILRMFGTALSYVYIFHNLVKLKTICEEYCLDFSLDEGKIRLTEGSDDEKKPINSTKAGTPKGGSYKPPLIQTNETEEGGVVDINRIDRSIDH